MTLDTSDAAIEAALAQAERGGVNAPYWIARAQVLATLRAGGKGPAIPDPPIQVPDSTGGPGFLSLPKRDDVPDIQIARGPYGDSFAVPAAATFEDRVTAAAILLAIHPDVLKATLDRAGFEIDSLAIPKPEPVPVPLENVGPLDIESEDEHQLDLEGKNIDADFFAEAKAEHKGRKK